jgi:hypothetical protein
VVRHDGRQRLDQVDEVRVRGLEVLDDGAELLALAVGEDARDLDVEPGFRTSASRQSRTAT